MKKLSPASFLGIDLAWSERNPSGLAWTVPEGSGCVLLETDRLTSDREILYWINERSAKTTWIGIDAPIIAPNPPGTCRTVDRVVSALFGRFHAGVYPGNRERCRRAVALARKLKARSFSANPYLPSRSGRRQLEVFPHLLQVSLFRRRRIIKYKKGAVSRKRRGIKILQNTMARLLPLQSPPFLPSHAFTGLLAEEPSRLKGHQLKGLEDRLDAVLCAYLTFYFWVWGERRCDIFGGLKEGYIIGPKRRGPADHPRQKRKK